MKISHCVGFYAGNTGMVAESEVTWFIWYNLETLGSCCILSIKQAVTDKTVSSRTVQQLLVEALGV